MRWVIGGRRCALLAMLALAGCQVVADPPDPIMARPVQLADGTVVMPPEDAERQALEAEVLGFTELQISVPRGGQMGIYRFPALVGCPTTRLLQPLYFKRDRFSAIEKDFPDDFFRVMSGHGYRMRRDPGKLFHEAHDEAAVYLVGANVSAMHVDADVRCDFFGNIVGVVPKSTLTVDWQVYSPLRQEIVWRGQTNGAYQAQGMMPDDYVLPLAQAFADAANRLAVMPEFRAAVAEKPVRPAARNAGRAPAPGTVVDAALAVQVVEKLGPLAGGLQANIDQVRAATLLIEDGAGHGSGVVISEGGLALTNHHVVGGNRFVKVRLVSGRSVLGEVLRVDVVRDVALLRLEGQGYRSLPVRPDPVQVTEEVYAVGAPKDKSLGWTVTRGIVSAWRQGFVRADRMDIIQSDVEVHGGNSGGPLVDANGNLVGLAVHAYFKTPEQTGIGLNGFIPIHDGLEKLKVRLMTEAEIRRGRRDGSIRGD